MVGEVLESSPSTLLRGHGRYTDDVNVAGQAYAVMVRSQVAHGVIKGIDTAEAKAMHGLARALVNNMVKGVSEGFQKKLEIQGVGFKANLQGSVINLALGSSHPINYPVPAGIKVVVEEGTKLTIDGADKELVGRVASEIRSFYPPEPYKGKGVRYVGEHIVRKEGKTVQ